MTAKKLILIWIRVILFIICIVAVWMFLWDSHCIHNPLTPQQFAVTFQTNLLQKGTATYYRRMGPILYEMKTTENGEHAYWLETIIAQRDSINVSAEFFNGMDYAIHNDRINLKGEPVIEWEIRRENFSDLESFTLKKEDMTLTHYSSDTKTEDTVTLSEHQFNELTESLICLPLENYPEDTADCYYELGIKLKYAHTLTLGPQYLAIVDAKEEWEFIFDAFEQAR